MNLDQFIKWEQASRDSIDVKKIYVDVSDDLIAGVLLSQIVYWFLPNQNGQPKLRVHKNGHIWLVKSREDWWEECRIKPRQYDTAIKKLIDVGILEKATFKFNGDPTTHIRIVWDTFLTLLNKNLEKQQSLDNTGSNESVITISQPGRSSKFKAHEITGYHESVIRKSHAENLDNTGFNKTVITTSQNGDSVMSKSVRTLTEITTENLSSSNIRVNEEQANSERMNIEDTLITDLDLPNDHLFPQPIESENGPEMKSDATRSVGSDAIEREIAFSQIVEFHERHGFGFMNPMFVQEISYWIDNGNFDEPEQIILQALKEALLANNRNWKYVNGILRKWSDAGLRTIKQIEAHIAEFKAQKQKWHKEQRNLTKHGYRHEPSIMPLPPMVTPEDIEKYGW